MDAATFLVVAVAALVLVLKVCACTTERESCSMEDAAGCSAGTHHSMTINSRWQGYLDLIASSVAEYGGCVGECCDCLGNQIAQDLKVWRERGGIDTAEFEQAKARRGGVHYQIVNHTLYREEECMFPSRCTGIEHFILKIIDALPDTEMIVNVRDNPQSPTYRGPLPILSFSKTPANYDIMYPAWTFWAGGPAISTEPKGLGRWDLKRETIAESSDKWLWEDKRKVAFFRGSRTSSERDPLMLLSRKRPELVDAAYTKNQAWKSDKDTLGAPAADVVTLEHHCQYRYLFNFRGVAASFRLKHLFLCKSLVFHVGDEWEEFFYPALRPWVHYIPVPVDLGNVEELLEFVRENDEVAHEIAERGRDLIWAHLTMEMVECYWSELLKEYAALLNWSIRKNPELKLIH